MKAIELKKNNGCILSQSKGQVMMIVVMVLSGVIIGATAIAGFLTARQTRQTADVGSSSKVLFAADAGLEWGMYKFDADDMVCKDCESTDDKGEACDERPVINDNDINNSTIRPDVSCNTSSYIREDGQKYNKYIITSTAQYKETSHSFNKRIDVVQ